jgi:hypothetical protein
VVGRDLYIEHSACLPDRHAHSSRVSSTSLRFQAVLAVLGR